MRTMSLQTLINTITLVDDPDLADDLRDLLTRTAEGARQAARTAEARLTTVANQLDKISEEL